MAETLKVERRGLEQEAEQLTAQVDRLQARIRTLIEEQVMSLQGLQHEIFKLYRFFNGSLWATD